MSDFRKLQELARLNGVHTSYLDMGGKPQKASPEILVAVLNALGVPANNAKEIHDALRETRLCPWQRGIEPVRVVWDQQPAKIEIRLPAQLAREPAKIRLEESSRGWGRDAGRAGGGWSSSKLHTRKTVKVCGESFVIKQFALRGLPWGYHKLEIAIGEKHFQSLIISALTRSYSGPDTRAQWGVFLPMYAAHSKGSWGAGNFSDWERFSRWIGSLGGSIAASLPLQAAFLDFPVCEPSPYSPASRLFWNEFYRSEEHTSE